MRSELVPRISAGRVRVSVSAVQLPIGPQSSSSGLSSRPAWKVLVKR
ncbi:MAG TPA: hypothetical protein VF530_11805 [Planctomycetota bacterium]